MTVHAVVLAVVAVLALPDEAWAQSVAGFRCARMTGGAIGVVHAPGSWERMGKSPNFVSLSPVLGASCAFETDAISAWVGAEAALTYAHYNGEGTLENGWLTATAGLSAGSPEWRFGAHMVGVPQPVGAGLHALWLPGDPQRRRDGFETRLTGYWLEHPNVQWMVLYVISTGKTP
jgi:hypothetical protein